MATAEINALGAQITMRMTRGDTLPLVIGLKNEDGTDRPLEVGDVIAFRVWDKYTKNNLITKTVTEWTPAGLAEITIEPEDKAVLIDNRTYGWEVEFIRKDGFTRTIIRDSELAIGEEGKDAEQ